MDKLKKVFSPGSSHDDQILYGDESSRKTTPAGSSEQDTTKLQPTQGAEKDHSVLRQITNPGGHKYDSLAYGTAASTKEPDSSQLQTPPGQKDHTVAQQILNPGGAKYDPQRFGTTREDTSIASPGSKQNANEGYGNSTKAIGDLSSTTYASHPSSAGATGTVTSREGGAIGSLTPASDLSIKSGKEGPYARADTQASDSQLFTGGSPTAHQTLPSQSESRAEPSSQAPSNSHVGRDAAFTSGAGLAGGAAAHELVKGRNEPSHQTQQSALSHQTPTTASHTGEARDASSDTSILNRPHPLAGGTMADSTASTMFGGQGSDRERGIHQPGQGIEPAAAGRNDNSSTGAGLGAGIGAGADALAGGVAGSQLNKSHNQGENIGSNIGSSDISQNPSGANPGGFGIHHTQGPHPTDVGNQLDPGLHIPGEFPSESGEEHQGFGTTASTSTGAGQSNLTSTHESPQAPTGLASTQGSRPDQGKDSHIGRDLTVGAAVGGGAGALASGLSGKESSQKPNDFAPNSSSTTANTHSPSQTVADAGAGSGLGSSHTPATDVPASKHKHTLFGSSNPTSSHAPDGKPHHHTSHFLGGMGFGGPMTGAALGGRGVGEGPQDLEYSPARAHHAKHHGDHHHETAAAAGAGAAGAAGVGAYEASKSRDDTGPASKTIGPHESNLANIADPRVKPEPSKMKDHSTTGSDLSNSSILEKEHNKLHKAHPKESEHSEKKPSLIHRILHPGEHKKESEHAATNDMAASTSQSTAPDGRVTEPHTGLPMNVDRYGSGAGGTDASSSVPGHHQTDSAVAGPDWEAVRKANTPY